jgi:hypothetical protein
MYVAYGFLALAALLGAKALGLLGRLQSAAVAFLPRVRIEAPPRRPRIWRRRYDYKHARALVSAGRMGEQLSQTFDVGEPEIAPNSVSWTLRPPKRLSETTPLVVATERDAAIAKVDKWIKRGLAMEEGFTPLPAPDEIEAMSAEAKRTWIQALGLMGGDERSRLEEWHHGVIEDLRMIGGGALDLYSANEKLSRAWQMVPLNRTFLRERIEELQAIGARLGAPEDEGELFDKLYPLRRRGNDILRRRSPGVEEDLVDRAAEKWIDGVRELTERRYPEFALHFMIPRPSQGRPRHDGQSRRLIELVPRLNFFLRELKALWITYASYGIGDKTLNPRDRLNARIADDRLNFRVDDATMGGDPAPGEQKLLFLRWVQDGLELDRSFDDRTHVGLPDPKSSSGEAT